MDKNKALEVVKYLAGKARKCKGCGNLESDMFSLGYYAALSDSIKIIHDVFEVGGNDVEDPKIEFMR